jgi:hypothetical protein
MAVEGALSSNPGDKSGAAGLWAGRPGGTGHLAGSPAVDRADPAAHRKPKQTTSPAAPPGQSGLPPDGPAPGPARPTRPSFDRRFHPLSF